MVFQPLLTPSFKAIYLTFALLPPLHLGQYITTYNKIKVDIVVHNTQLVSTKFSALTSFSSSAHNRLNLALSCIRIREKSPFGKLRCQTKILDISPPWKFQSGREVRKAAFKALGRYAKKDDDVRRGIHVKTTMGNVM
jgi:hypothetical protein